MFQNFTECDSSRCSTASPVGDSLPYYQHSPSDSVSSMGSPMNTHQDFCTDIDVSSSPFVPTVTTISTSQNLQWMVQPTLITSTPPVQSRAHPYKVPSSKIAGARGQSIGRRGKIEQLSPEEEEKKKIRRERNKMAAAKCRNRRKELTDTLQAETDNLEDDKAALQTEIANLLKEKEKLELILAAHQPACRMTEDIDALFHEPAGFPQEATADEDSKVQSSTLRASTLQDLEMSIFSTTPISGNSNLLLCSSGEVSVSDLEPSLDLKEEPLDELFLTTERSTMETARSVPDIDLSSSFGVADWETLYKSVSNDLEPLSTPTVTSTPTCPTYLSAFAFTYPDLDSFPDCGENPKGGINKSDPALNILNSPTLLAL